MTRDIGTALASAVARMERNASQPGTTIARPEDVAPQRIGIVTGPGGAVLLPALPALPPADGALAQALGAAGAPALRDGDNIAHRPSPLAAPEAVRSAAAARAEWIGRVLAPVAEDSLIQEWLGRWAPHCAKRGDQDYFGWEAGVLLAVRKLPAVAFCDETAERAAQSPTFKWLPVPAEVFALLTAFLAPHRDALYRARAVAAARDPEPKATEAAGPRRLTPAEAEALATERRAAISGAMARFRENMARGTEMHARMAGATGDGRPKPRYAAPMDHAVVLRREIAAYAGDPLASGAVNAMRTRLESLARLYPDVAEWLERSDDVESEPAR